MVTVNFTGGTRKIFQTDSLVLTNKIESISELITFLISNKPTDTPNFDGKNLLIAVNGVDSSALNGNETELKPNDVVNIIPIIHGGTQLHYVFSVNNFHVGIFEINKSCANKEFLFSLRVLFPQLVIKAISSKFIINKDHAQKIVNISLNQKSTKNLLSAKLETDILLRFANTTQINQAIKNVGLSKNENFILIAIGSKSNLTKLHKHISDDLDVIFKRDSSNFLKKYFGISNTTLNSIESKTPLVDLLVERASILVS